ncbi:MAG: hypothetical protein Q9160_006448 [Pyrenula sp. 1 TL-2023]
MSGIEAAGLVLGALPLVIAGLKFYIEGVTTITKYLRNICEELLQGLIEGQKMNLLLRSPGGHLWKDAQLEQKLRRRLQAAYVGYLDTLKDGKVRVLWHHCEVEVFIRRPVRHLLSNSLLSDWARFDDTSAFKRQFERLRFSLNPPEYKNLTRRIRIYNQSLGQITSQSLRLEPSRIKRSQCVPSFKDLQNYAKSVYATLLSGWRCGCRSSHIARLRLESRTENGDFNVENDGSARKYFQCRIVFSNDEVNSQVSAASATFWSWEEADIRLLKESGSQEAHGDIVLAIRPKKKGVRFSDDLQVAAEKGPEKAATSKPIENLCKTIQTFQQAHPDGCLGFLTDEVTRQKHGIFYPEKPLMSKDKWSFTPKTHRMIRNPVLFALGVLLIELCFGRPFEDLKFPDEKASPKDIDIDLSLDWVAADRLIDEVYLKAGDRYGDAVRHCIRCDFDRRGTSLEDEDFQRAVYDGVVSLLETDLKQFHNL